MAKKIFNSEVNQIRRLSVKFAFNLKSNCKQVILTDDNNVRLKQATKLLEQAANVLLEIK